jgi:hypothetical protein
MYNRPMPAAPVAPALDLGSGGGIDVLLSARRNAAEAGVTNAEFLRGEIERIPLPEASVDAIISNRVINLSVRAGPLRVTPRRGRDRCPSR